MSNRSRPRVIFVCVGNSCRSQMAEGFFNHLARERGVDLRAESAGTSPEGFVSPEAIDVMAEPAIDISHQTSKGVVPAELLDYDVVITLGCSDRDVCPATFRGDGRDWDIEDPLGESRDVFRRVRDEIKGRVQALLDELEPLSEPSEARQMNFGSASSQ